MNNFTHGSAHPIIVRQGKVEHEAANNNKSETANPIVNAKNLYQGQTFEKDISDILNQVNGIEQDFGYENLQQHFIQRKNKLENTLKKQREPSPSNETPLKYSSRKFVMSHKNQKRRNIITPYAESTTPAAKPVFDLISEETILSPRKIVANEFSNAGDVLNLDSGEVNPTLLNAKESPVNFNNETFSAQEPVIPRPNFQTPQAHKIQSETDHYIQEFASTFKPGGMRIGAN